MDLGVREGVVDLVLGILLVVPGGLLAPVVYQ